MIPAATPSASSITESPLMSAHISARFQRCFGPGSFATSTILSRSLRQKRRSLLEKQIQLVMMQPMTSLGHGDQAAIADRFHSGITLRHGGKTFQSPEKHGGRSDLAVDLSAIGDVVAERRHGAHIVIELPGQRSIGVPVGSVQRE